MQFEGLASAVEDIEFLHELHNGAEDLALLVVVARVEESALKGGFSLSRFVLLLIEVSLDGVITKLEDAEEGIVGSIKGLYGFG